VHPCGELGLGAMTRGEVMFDTDGTYIYLRNLKNSMCAGSRRIIRTGRTAVSRRLGSSAEKFSLSGRIPVMPPHVSGQKTARAMGPLINIITCG
jgi:hypothetical protein